MSSDSTPVEGGATPAPESTPVSTPVAAETPPASTPETAPQPAETVASSEAPERPKVKLNPTVDPGARAVPSLSAEEANQAGEPTGGPSATYVPPSGPIEIPNSKETQLDAETEAEIAQALASGELPTVSGDIVIPTTSVPTLLNEEELESGARLKAKVQAIPGENVILDLGYRSSGCVPTKQFDGKLPELGSVIDVVVDKVVAGEGLIYCNLPRASRQVSGWNEVQVGQIVDCLVTKTNKGGLEVQINTIRGFLPAGQVEIGFVSSLETYVGQKLRVKVTEVNPQKRNLVVSRRQVLEVERGEKREEMWKTIAVGQNHFGVVKTIKEYGAFVDLGGVDGLLHVGEISWSRINHPSDVLKEGQQIEVVIVQIDQEKNKVSLGMKQLQRNPWTEIETKYPINSSVTGKVTRTTEFGAFVELETGIEGLIHISELEYRRVHRVNDVVKEGQEVVTKVLSIDLPKKRIALSLKQMQAPPASAKKEEPEIPQAAPYERKRKGDLKGGTGGSGPLRFG